MTAHAYSQANRLSRDDGNRVELLSINRSPHHLLSEVS